MIPTLPDVMNALDELEILFRNIFEDFKPLYDTDQHTMRRALAVLHAYVREQNQP